MQGRLVEALRLTSNKYWGSGPFASYYTTSQPFCRPYCPDLGNEGPAKEVYLKIWQLSQLPYRVHRATPSGLQLGFCPHWNLENFKFWSKSTLMVWLVVMWKSMHPGMWWSSSVQGIKWQGSRIERYCLFVARHWQKATIRYSRQEGHPFHTTCTSSLFSKHSCISRDVRTLSWIYWLGMQTTLDRFDVDIILRFVDIFYF